MHPVRLIQVDAFTDRPFAGNPAAVCLLSHERESSWMQAVAAEMNLSETAFVRPLGNEFDLRWFTPTVEVDLCGHATLAAAHALWTEEIVFNDQQIRFHTKSGLLAVSQCGERIELELPATAPTQDDPPELLLAALGVKPTFVGRSKFDWLVVVDSEQIIRSLEVNFGLLRRVPARGVIITAPSHDGRFDFVSRFFAPAIGIDEDPVCGSAHCCLGPFWCNRLGKTEMTAYQASSRGGVVHVRVGDNDRVILGGQAVTVLRGELLP